MKSETVQTRTTGIAMPMRMQWMCFISFPLVLLFLSHFSMSFLSEHASQELPSASLFKPSPAKSTMRQSFKKCAPSDL
jgi:hypothetical protein